MSTTSIHDLPNELLDEIFSYVIPEINENAIKPINTVCKRWNRPFMTQTLANYRIPEDIDLQAKFPKLTYFKLSAGWRTRYFKDFRLFKGHAFVKGLLVYGKLVLSVLNCPRLTSLTMDIVPEHFFNDDNLHILLALLPSLHELSIHVNRSHGSSQLIKCYKQKMESILQTRPKSQKLKLKRLAPHLSEGDFILFCRLFETSSLEHCQIYHEFKSPAQVLQFLEVFQKASSLESYGSSLVRYHVGIFEHVTSLKLMMFSSDETLSFSLLLNQFPNVESLYVRDCPIKFDLEYPTRLTDLRVSFIGTVQPRLFGHLKTLEWTLDSNQFNYVMRELGKHCPHLTTIKMRQWKKSTNWIVPELDDIVFPLLVTLHLGIGNFKFNSSLFRFLARHGQLKSIKCDRGINFEDDWESIESDRILWPYLRELIIHCTEYSTQEQQIREWFVKNAPNVKDFDTIIV